MERIQGQVAAQVELAKHVLFWITCALRPLTTVELQHALAVEVGEQELDKENLPDLEDMVSSCAGLVTVEEQSDIIRLVHYTTQEYFKRTQDHWFPNAETAITEVCITYLSFDSFANGRCESTDEYEERLRLNPFYAYAAIYWGHHARHTSTLDQEILDFLQCKAKVEAASQAVIPGQRHSHSANHHQCVPGLHLAAWFGLEREVKTFLLHPEVEVGARDGYGWTPLMWAARGNNYSVVKLLLDTGNSDPSAQNDNGVTAFWLAVIGNHEAIAKLLLHESPLDVAPQPLFPVVKRNLFGMVKLLLDSGKVNPDVTDTCGRAPLFYAAMKGYHAIAKLLLDTYNASADPKCNFGRTPLSIAAEKGHQTIINLLLATDKVDVDSRDNAKRTPLWYAAQEGHEAVLTTLLCFECVDPDPKDYYGFTALSVAVRHQRTAAVKRLLNTGRVDIASHDLFGKTPLWYARKLANAGIIRLLLEHSWETGLSVSQDDLPTSVAPDWPFGTPRYGNPRYGNPRYGYTRHATCDVCTRKITREEIYYSCEVCNDADYDICVDCYEMGARCLDPGHQCIIGR